VNPITHALSGWCLAAVLRRSTRRERFLITAAAVVPDLDGLGMIAELATRDSPRPLLWWTEYHHVLCHNLTFITAFACAAALSSRSLRTLVLAFASGHLHLLGDIVGSRGPDGYQWPIPYLAPFRDDVLLAWNGQWQLNAWQNVVITLILLAATFRLAWRRGESPLVFISPRADAVFVAALRARFGQP
jgi:hypothetical protein